MTFIYTLKDPRTGACRYVGKSDNPKDRLRCHLKDTVVCYRTNWIKELTTLGLKPILEVIDTVPKSEWKFWEREYISLFRALGFQLVNGTDGGDGMNNPLPETREKISASRRGEKNPFFGRKHSPETLEKMSAAHRGRVFSPEHRAKISLASFGRRLSTAAIVKLRIDNAGKNNPFFGCKHSAEARAKISAARRARINTP